MPFKKRTFGDWLLFPFIIYLLVAPIELLVWHEMTVGYRVKGALAEGTFRIVLGYLLCFLVFTFAAIIRFITRRRELVAENLLLAAIAFVISQSLSLCAL